MITVSPLERQRMGDILIFAVDQLINGRASAVLDELESFAQDDSTSVFTLLIIKGELDHTRPLASLINFLQVLQAHGTSVLDPFPPDESGPSGTPTQ